MTMMGKQEEANFGFCSNWPQLSLHFVLAVLIGTTLRLTTFKEATGIASQLGSDKYVSKTSFLVSFGFTKAISNLAVGRASDVWGRKAPHAVGWGFGVLLGCLSLKLASMATASASNNGQPDHQLWVTYILANVCLGAQQGMTWTTNIFMFLDIGGPDNRALASAISNSVGYLASAFSTYAAASLSTNVAFSLVLGCSLLGCLISILLVRDTTHFVTQEAECRHDGQQSEGVGGMQEMVHYPNGAAHGGKQEEERNDADATIHQNGGDHENSEAEVERASKDRFHLDSVSDPPLVAEASSFASVFWGTCWKNPSAAVLCWGGLTANLVTSLAWGLVLIWGHQQDLSSLQLANVGSAFTFSKAIAMIASGCLSDRYESRKAVLLGGYLVAATGLLLTAWADATENPTDIYRRLCLGGIVIGLGIGGVYCILTAGLSDHTAPRDRASAIGVYKLWRDSGYAIGGLLTGLVADASGGNFVTTTTVVAGFVMVLVMSIICFYEEVSKVKTSFEPVELVENISRTIEIN